MSDHYFTIIKTGRRPGFTPETASRIRGMLKQHYGRQWFSEVKSKNKDGKSMWGTFMFIVQDWDLWDGSALLGKQLKEQLEDLGVINCELSISSYDEMNREVFKFQKKEDDHARE